MNSLHIIEILAQIKANSNKNEIKFDSERNYIIFVKAPPVKNKANKEILKLLKSHFKAEKVILKSGQNSKNKRFQIYLKNSD